MKVDVCVVGGGPAGAAAAITLARAGCDVVVIDKARFPRDKCCGDGLTTGALRRLEALGLQPETIPSWQVVRDIQIRSPSARTVRFSLPRGQGIYAAVARRTELDAALVELARTAGATVYDGHALVAAVADRQGRGLELEVTGLGTVTAAYAIGADGMWSPLAKALGSHPQNYLGEWHAFRQYVAGVSGSAASALWVWFEPDLLPGYAWAFPLEGGRVNIGMGTLRAPGRPTRFMKALWDDVMSRHHIRATLGEGAQPEAPPRSWPIPARLGTATPAAAGGRALFVGDAVGATDPMTGEGIAQALETGVLAAEAIVTAGARHPEQAAERYRQGIHRSLLPDHRLSLLLSRALRHPQGARGSVRVAGLTPWTRRNFARWLFEDEPRAVLLTPRRWHRSLLRRPGAYQSSDR